MLMLKFPTQYFHIPTLFEYSTTSWAPVIVFKVCVICSESPSVRYHFQMGWEVYRWGTTDLIPTRTRDEVTKYFRKCTFLIIPHLAMPLIQILATMITAQQMWLAMFYTWTVKSSLQYNLISVQSESQVTNCLWDCSPRWWSKGRK